MGYEGIIANGDNSSITINNVKNINLGTSREDLLNVSNHSSIHSGVAIHGFKGAVNIGIGDGKQATVDTLNVYSANVGIMAQHTGGSGAGSVNIHVNKAVNVYADDSSAIQVSNFGTDGNPDTKDSTELSIISEGTVSAFSNGYAAVVLNDQYQKTDEPQSGTSSIIVQGKNGVSIRAEAKPDGTTSKSTFGIRYFRQAENAQSGITVSSENGDVDIFGEAGAVSFENTSTNTNGTGMTGKIHGENVRLSSSSLNGSTYATVDLKGQNNILDITGNTVTVDAGTNEQAVSVNGNNTKLTFGDGENATDVYVNGYVTVTDGASATFAEKTTTHVDSKYLTTEGKNFITTGNRSGTVNLNGKLDIGNVATGTPLNFSDNTDLNRTAADAIITNNLLQNINLNKETGEMTVGTVDKATAAERLGGSALTNVALAATENNMDGVTALITNNASDTDAVKAALNSAAGFSGLANVAHGTYTMNGLFSDAVSGHLMNRQDQDVWAYGFHSKENVNGFSFGGDYDAQYNGVTAGVDLYKNGGTTAGVALTYGDSNVSGSNGFATTKSDSDYYGASIYGRFDRGSYALLGDISYMKGDHDVTQYNSKTIITASPDSDSISVGVKALKDYAAGDNGVLTPYVGLRYLRLSTDDFTANNGLHYVGDDQDMVIVPVGVNYTASISHGKWSVRPYAGIGYVWTAGDRSADQTVVVPGGADSFSYDTADSSSFIARVGVTTDCDDMSYGIGYSWQKGDSVSNNAWTVSASYHF